MKNVKVNTIFDDSVEQPQIKRGWLESHEDYTGFRLEFPYIHIIGNQPGPRLTIVACVHGDELNGIPIIHKIAEYLDPHKVTGQILLLPIANIQGFHFQSRYMADRKDLNRLFPGTKKGSEGSRYAHFIFEQFIQNADFLIDLHAAGSNRWNYPHIRGQMKSATVRKMAKLFGAEVCMQSSGIDGSLRHAAASNNIPAILFEAGQTNRFEPYVVDIGVQGIWNILFNYEMVNYWPQDLQAPQETKKYYKSFHWVRSNYGGLFLAKKFPGDLIKKGETLGIIKSILGEVRHEIKAKVNGKIIGFNLHPQVVPGRALYHVARNEIEI